MEKHQYAKAVKRASPNSKKGKDFLCAFTVGGLICAVGQLIREIYAQLGIGETGIQTLVPVTLIFIAVLLTGLKIFDKIAKHAGAGTLVPITGFANAVAAPAIEFKKEGFILGVGAKMFSIAGPVILYGTTASVIYGVIYYIVCKLG